MLTPAVLLTGKQRGAVSLVLKYLRLLQIDPVGDTSQALADLLISKLETRKIAQPGVYRCADTGKLDLQLVTQTADIDTSKPVLSSARHVFQHRW